MVSRACRKMPILNVDLWLSPTLRANGRKVREEKAEGFRGKNQGSWEELGVLVGLEFDCWRTLSGGFPVIMVSLGGSWCAWLFLTACMAEVCCLDCAW